MSSTMYERSINALFGSWPRTLGVVFLVALLARIVLIFALQKGFYFADEPIYTAAARHLLAHGEFPADYGRAPLYPLFLAGIYALAGDSITVSRIVQAVLGACFAMLLAMLGKRTGNPAVGATAGILWGIYPMGVFIASLLYPTTLLAVLLAAGVLCLLADPEGRGYTLRVAIAGLLFGVAALAKPIVLGSIALVTGWVYFRRRSGRIQLAGTFLVAAIIALTPWTIRNAYVYHRLVPIEARSLQDVTLWAYAGEAVRWADPRKLNMGCDSENKTWVKFCVMAKRFPGEFVSFFELYPRRVNYLKQEYRDWAVQHRPNFVQHTSLGAGIVNAVSIISVSTLYVFALVGMRVLWRARGRRWELALYILMVLSFALGYAVSWGKIRYRVPVDPYIIMLSAWGMMYVWKILEERRHLRQCPHDDSTRGTP
jgi:4-amino-4-deoxy-L-arabinose transferase-like glycosyltransferase